MSLKTLLLKYVKQLLIFFCKCINMGLYLNLGTCVNIQAQMQIFEFFPNQLFFFIFLYFLLLFFFFFWGGGVGGLETHVPQTAYMPMTQDLDSK